MVFLVVCFNLVIKGWMMFIKEGLMMVFGFKDDWFDRQVDLLFKGEVVVESYLVGCGMLLLFNVVNGKFVSVFGDKFVFVINKEYGGVYFWENGVYLLLGFGISVVIIVVLFYFGDFSDV